MLPRIHVDLLDESYRDYVDLVSFNLLNGFAFECGLFLLAVRNNSHSTTVPYTSNLQANNPSETTTQMNYPSYSYEPNPMRNSDVAAVKTVQNQQPVTHLQPQQYTQMQNQHTSYIPNTSTNNADFSTHTNNQSHIYVNAPNPVTLSQRPHGQQWSHDISQQNIPGHHNHIISQLHDHSTHRSAQMHPGSSGHVPYSPTLGPSNNYQNVEVIRQVQYQQQNHPQFHNSNSPQQRIVPPSNGDRNIHIVGRNKPVGTVAPNTHTTASTVQPRMIGRLLRNDFDRNALNPVISTKLYLYIRYFDSFMINVV